MAQLQTIYLGYRNDTNPNGYYFISRSNGADTRVSLPANFLCSDPSGMVSLQWNYFVQNYSINVPVNIYAVRLNVFDSAASGSNKWFSIQRNSDNAMLAFVDMEAVSIGCCNVDYGGSYITLDPTDQLLVESAYPVGNQRAIGASIFYTT